MAAGDARPDDVAFYRRRVETVLSLRGKQRFLAKYPRLSLRVEWLDAVFPGALFVHVCRDWRAVLASTLLRKRKREQRGGRLVRGAGPGLAARWDRALPTSWREPDSSA